ncbi:MAG: hypothetical protein K6G40_03200 [Eubacterium sp.]|nr:hypothetical protein [Eubacterium sp.]
MYSQFFGNFLVEKGIIDRAQLLEVLSKKKEDAPIHPGLLAVYKEYLIGHEAKEIMIKESQTGMSFYEICSEQMALTSSQIEALQKLDPPYYLHIAQHLIDSGISDIDEMAECLFDYESQFEIIDLDLMKEINDKVDLLLMEFDMICDSPYKNELTDYIILLFNNLIHYIGTDFEPLSIQPFPQYYSKVGSVQKIIGEPCFFTEIDMSEESAIKFASRFAGDQFDELNEYVTASLDDFLNQHNGVFVVNQSNLTHKEFTLEPPVSSHDEVQQPKGEAYFLTITFHSCGYINFYISAY